MVEIAKLNNNIMKIQLVKCSNKSLWYSSLKFPVKFEVEKSSNSTYKIIKLPEDWGTHKYDHIFTYDCINDEDYIEDKLGENKLNMNKPRVFSSGAKRDNDNDKPCVHSFKAYTRLRFGYHMRIGASKYGDKNWELGMPTDQYFESVDRHLASYLNGDRSEDHLSAILFGIQGVILNEQKEGVKEDCYFKPTTKE